jgi:cytochrome P450
MAAARAAWRRVMAEREAPRFHPLDPRDAEHAFEKLPELSARCPVSHQTHASFDPITLVASYEHVSDVYHRRGEFSNRYGHSILVKPGELHNANNLFTLDGESHRRVRRILVSALTPRHVEAAVPYIMQLAESVVRAIPDSGRVELRSAWATLIPGKAVAHLIGVPDADHNNFFHWTMQKMAALTRVTQGQATVADVRAAEAPFNEFLDEQLRRRRSGEVTSDDILTRLLALEDEEGGGKLSDEEIRANCMFLLNAGNQTTQNLLTSLVHQLVTSGLWRTLRQDRSLVPLAIEESLRLTPPIQYGVRRPVHDIEIGGCPVRHDTPVVLSHVAANRDPRVWGDHGDEFRLDRTNSEKHLGFGMGPHACIGSAAARKIALIAMNALLDRFESLALAPDFQWKRQDYWTSLGMTSLEVVWAK